MTDPNCPIRKPLSWIPNDKAPKKICPDCGELMQGSYQTDAASHDGWLTIHRIEFWLYYCNKCEKIEETAISYDGCKICEERDKEYKKKKKELVQFT